MLTVKNASQRRFSSHSAWIALVVTAVLALAACGSGSDDSQKDSAELDPVDEPGTFLVSGTLTLIDSEVDAPRFWNTYTNCEEGDVCPYPGDETCSGDSEGGFQDITGGAQLTVTSSSGEIVALGSLDRGKTEAVENANEYLPACIFTFSVMDVPDSGDIYSIRLGNRLASQFTKADAASLAFTISED